MEALSQGLLSRGLEEAMERSCLGLLERVPTDGMSFLVRHMGCGMAPKPGGTGSFSAPLCALFLSLAHRKEVVYHLSSG